MAVDKLKWHQVQCKICKSKLLKDFNERFIEGEAAHMLAHEMGFETHTADRHVQAFKLLDERYKSAKHGLMRFLAHCEYLMRLRRLEAKAPSFVVALKLLADINKEVEQSNPLVVLIQNMPENDRERVQELLTADESVLTRLIGTEN